MKSLMKSQPTRWWDAKAVLIVSILLTFNYLYLTADYSMYTEAIIDWHSWHIFAGSFHWANYSATYNEAALKAFKSSIDVSCFYILEAASFALFSYVLYGATVRFYKAAFGAFTYFFSIRLLFEIYACAFGLSINLKYFGLTLFFVTLCIILFFLFYFMGGKKEQQTKTNTS